MGADQFETHAYGTNASEAFDRATADARYDYGHAGYTGTIAEKPNFVIAKVLTGTVDEAVDALEVSYLALKRRDVLDGDGQEEAATTAATLERIFGRNWREVAEVYDDKWGPAVCIPTEETNEAGETKFIFVGWASC